MRSTAPASRAAPANQSAGMLSAVAVAADSATSSEPHLPSRSSTCSDVCQQVVGDGETAPAGSGLWHSGAFVGAKDGESYCPAIMERIKAGEAGARWG